MRFQLINFVCPAILCSLYLLVGQPLSAQSGTVERSDEIRRALQRADYQLAVDLADSAIAHFDNFAPKQLAEIHTLRAFVASEKGDRSQVDVHFLAALQLNPNQKLDTIFFSPALQQHFESMRARLPASEAAGHVETRYVMVSDPRLTAAWKSLVLPGWGQRFKGENARGNIFTFASVALAGAALTSHFLRTSARDDYFNANELNVAAAYDRYNKYHLLRNNLALGLGLVWSAAILDALIFKPKPGKIALRLSPRKISNEKNLTVLVTFSF